MTLKGGGDHISVRTKRERGEQKPRRDDIERGVHLSERGAYLRED